MLTIATIAAETDSNTLAFLRDHPKDWPKQVAVKEATEFKVIFEGKVMGSMTLPASGLADLIQVTDEGLLLGSASSRATVAPEKTDLWERVQAVRAAQIQAQAQATAESSAAAPAVPVILFPLPVNSQRAEWYATEIEKQVDPWLTQNPDHPQKAEVIAKKEAYLAEAARVRAGEARRGSRWYSASETVEWRGEFEAQDLLASVEEAGKKKDIEAVQALIFKLPNVNRTETHPRLIRAFESILNAIQAGISLEEERAALQKKKETLQQEVDRRIAELRARCKSFVVEGYSSKRSKDDVRGADNLYRPPGEYYTAYLHGPLAPYYPTEPALYRHPSVDEQNSMYADAGEIDRVKGSVDAATIALERVGDTVKKKQERLVEMIKGLQVPVAEAEEKALEVLKQAEAKPEAAELLFAEVKKAWPTSQALSRAALDQAVTALDAIPLALAAGKNGEAVQLHERVQRLMAYVVQDSPRRDKTEKAWEGLRPAIAKAKEDAPKGSLTSAGTTSGTAGEIPAAGQARREEATKKLDQAHAALMSFHLKEAYETYQEARAMWPQNPGLDWWRNLFYVAGGAGLIVAFLVWREIRNRWM
ncbi:MAG: hypothetical protein B9S32_13495 [Verrucomicrobia bacterium Tous-C9LFEB]|nr:MAG: hypothetical protein B9S32_13495 [Verrucomicrobia bacterium Tous-C9LFEB]